jgi:hypothetical protein
VELIFELAEAGVESVMADAVKLSAMGPVEPLAVLE